MKKPFGLMYRSHRDVSSSQSPGSRPWAGFPSSVQSYPQTRSVRPVVPATKPASAPSSSPCS